MQKTQVNILQKSVTYARYHISSANILPSPFCWKFLIKTAILGQNRTEDGIIGNNWQNIMEFSSKFEKKL